MTNHFRVIKKGWGIFEKTIGLQCSNCGIQFPACNPRLFGADEFAQLWNHGMSCVDIVNPEVVK